MNEYDVQDPYGTYNVGDELKPYEILNQMKSWDKEIRLTVSAVTTDLTSTRQQQAQILLDIDSIDLSVIDISGRLGTAESTIIVQAGQIALKATQVQVDGIASRMTSAEINIDGLSASILLKANSSVTDGLNTRLGSAEVNISGLTSSIALKASSLTTDGLNTRLGSAELDIDGLQGQISLKAESSVTDSLGTRMSSAEVNISSLNGSISSKVSQTDYNGNTIVSLMNQTATTITLLAENIELLGITQVANSLTIGNSFQDSTPKSIIFRGTSGGVGIYSPAMDQLSIEAVNSIILSTNQLILGAGTTLDFNNRPVTNHPFSLSGHNHSGIYSAVGHTHSEYSTSGHVHADTDYVKPSSGQAIMLGVATATKKINVYVAGVVVGQLTYV